MAHGLMMHRKRKVLILVVTALIALPLYYYLYQYHPVIFGLALLFLIIIGMGASKILIIDRSVETYHDDPSATDPSFFIRFRGR